MIQHLFTVPSTLLVHRSALVLFFYVESPSAPKLLFPSFSPNFASISASLSHPFHVNHLTYSLFSASSFPSFSSYPSLFSNFNLFIYPFSLYSPPTSLSTCTVYPAAASLLSHLLLHHYWFHLLHHFLCLFALTLLYSSPIKTQMKTLLPSVLSHPWFLLAFYQTPGHRKATIYHGCGAKPRGSKVLRRS